MKYKQTDDILSKVFYNLFIFRVKIKNLLINCKQITLAKFLICKRYLFWGVGLNPTRNY